MANVSAISRNEWMLRGPLAEKGYDWWWHNLTAVSEKTGEKKPFYIEFFTCNPNYAEKEPVIVWNDKLAQDSGKKPSYLMVNVGFWGEKHGQLHRFFSLKDVDIHADPPFYVQADDCYCDETCTRGSVKVTKKDAKAHPEWMCDAGQMKWELTLEKQIAFNVGYGASKPLRDAEAFAMYWHAEGMKTAYSGWVECNGRRYVVTPERSYGYADKNWGRDFTSPWVWLASSCLTSKRTGAQLSNSAFDIGGGRPKIYFVPLDRRLLGVFCYEGREYDFNFSKLHLRVQTDFSFEELDDLVVWHVRQENIHAAMETEIRCRKADMLFVNYESPDGAKRHNRLWNGGNGWGVVRLYDKKDGELVLIDEIEATHVGCEYGEYDEPASQEIGMAIVAGSEQNA